MGITLLITRKQIGTKTEPNASTGTMTDHLPEIPSSTSKWVE